jgi:hypothetical protein
MVKIRAENHHRPSVRTKLYRYSRRISWSVPWINAAVMLFAIAVAVQASPVTNACFTSLIS